MGLNNAGCNIFAGLVILRSTPVRLIEFDLYNKDSKIKERNSELTATQMTGVQAYFCVQACIVTSLFLFSDGGTRGNLLC